MSHDLSLARSNAFALASTLMVPVTLFEVGVGTRTAQNRTLRANVARTRV